MDAGNDVALRTRIYVDGVQPVLRNKPDRTELAQAVKNSCDQRCICERFVLMPPQTIAMTR